MNEAMNGGPQMMGGQQQQEVEITLGDLSTILQVIDVVSTRGGFQGQELAGVGMLRNKLEAFLRQKAPHPDNSVGEQAVDVDASEVEGAPLADKVIDG